MSKTSVNPFAWHFADDQGVLVDQPRQMIFVSGQTAMSDDGQPQFPDDLGAQTDLTMENVKAVLAAGGLSLSDVVQLNTHVTDMDRFLTEGAEVLERHFAEAEVKPPGVLSQIVRLANPDLHVEIDAIAVR